MNDPRGPTKDVDGCLGQAGLGVPHTLASTFTPTHPCHLQMNDPQDPSKKVDDFWGPSQQLLGASAACAAREPAGCARAHWRAPPGWPAASAAALGLRTRALVCSHK